MVCVLCTRRRESNLDSDLPGFNSWFGHLLASEPGQVP